MAALRACYASCGFAWQACYAAAGLVAGTISAGSSAPVSAMMCNGAEGACMVACTNASSMSWTASVVVTALAAMYRKHLKATRSDKVHRSML